MIMLPIGRWSSLLQPGIQEPLRAALTAGASGVVLVTQNAAGVAAALNAPAIGPASFDRPVAIIGATVFDYLTGEAWNVGTSFLGDIYEA